MSEADVWTLQRCLHWTHRHLGGRPDADNPRLDAELLLAWALQVDRVALYMRWDQPLSLDERARYRAVVRRRAAGEPVAYILGRREFYSRPYQVDRRVLVPRPETEHLVEVALARLGGPAAGAHVVDVGCGSGAVAITLACEAPWAQVTGCDVSPEALAVARANAEALAPEALAAGRLRLCGGDLLAEVDGPITMVVSNPPYVADAAIATLPVDVRAYEPALALAGGPDGLALVRRLLADAAARLPPGGVLAMELGATQADAADALAAQVPGQAWAPATFAHDLQGHRRVAAWERR